MFDTRKRVFANKRNTLYAKPLCPYITDNAGYTTLSRQAISRYPGRMPNRKPRWGATR